MEPHSEYFRNARECRTLAERAASPEDKADWLRLAAKWESLAYAPEQRDFHTLMKPTDERTSA